MVLLMGGFLGFIILLAVVFLLLRLFSATISRIPGFERFFEFIVIMVPYLVFFAGYYYLYRMIPLSENKGSRVIATLIMVGGFIAFLFTLSIALLILLRVNNSFVQRFTDSTHYGLIVQVVVLLVAAGVIATGDAKEKDWKERTG
jgi:hypothetical protein